MALELSTMVIKPQFKKFNNSTIVNKFIIDFEITS